MYLSEGEHCHGNNVPDLKLSWIEVKRRVIYPEVCHRKNNSPIPDTASSDAKIFDIALHV